MQEKRKKNTKQIHAKSSIGKWRLHYKKTILKYCLPVNCVRSTVRSNGNVLRATFFMCEICTLKIHPKIKLVDTYNIKPAEDIGIPISTIVKNNTHSMQSSWQPNLLYTLQKLLWAYMSCMHMFVTIPSKSRFIRNKKYFKTTNWQTKEF